MSEERQVTTAHEAPVCDYDGELLQAVAVTSTPNLHLKGVVYVTTLYRCTVVKCRRTKTRTTEVRMPHP